MDVKITTKLKSLEEVTIIWASLTYLGKKVPKGGKYKMNLKGQ